MADEMTPALPRPLEVTRLWLVLAAAFLAVLVPGMSAVGAYVASRTAQAVMHERVEQRLVAVERGLTQEAEARRKEIEDARRDAARDLEVASERGRQERAALARASDAVDARHSADIAAIRASNEANRASVEQLTGQVAQLLGYLSGRFGMPPAMPRSSPGGRMDAPAWPDDQEEWSEALAPMPAPVAPPLPIPAPAHPGLAIPPRVFAETSW